MNLNPFKNKPVEPRRVLKFEDTKQAARLRQQAQERAEKLCQIHSIRPFKSWDELYKMASSSQAVTMEVFYKRHPNLEKTIQEAQKISADPIKVKLEDDLIAFRDLLKMIFETKAVTTTHCKLHEGKWIPDPDALEREIERTCRIYAVGDKEIAVWDLQAQICAVLNCLTPPEQGVFVSQGIEAMVKSEWSGVQRGGYLIGTPFVPVPSYEFRPLINGGFDCAHTEAPRLPGFESGELQIALMNNLAKEKQGTLELPPGERYTMKGW